MSYKVCRCSTVRERDRKEKCLTQATPLGSADTGRGLNENLQRSRCELIINTQLKAVNRQLSQRKEAARLTNSSPRLFHCFAPLQRLTKGKGLDSLLRQVRPRTRLQLKPMKLFLILAISAKPLLSIPSYCATSFISVAKRELEDQESLESLTYIISTAGMA